MAFGVGTVELDHGVYPGTNFASVSIPANNITATAKVESYISAADSTSDHTPEDHTYLSILANRVCEVVYSTSNTYPIISNSRTSSVRLTQPQNELILNKSNSLAYGLGFVLCGHEIYIDNTFGGNYTIDTSLITSNIPISSGIGNDYIDSANTVKCNLSTTNTYTVFAQGYINSNQTLFSYDYVVLYNPTYQIRISVTNSIYYVWYDGSGSPTFFSGSINTNTLYTFVIILRPTSTDVYVNGIKQGTFATGSLGLTFTQIQNYNNLLSSDKDNSPSICGIYHRELSINEVANLTKNIWQIFATNATRILQVSQIAGVPIGIKINSISHHKLSGRFSHKYVWNT
jgi:hypothetical protein